jgi:cellulose synthase/poly-beta-1,6-N-acetylglucosamine synthase-like glycosyltransferase
MASLFVTVFALYFVLLLILIVGEFKAFSVSSSKSSKGVFISVVVAMRNEKENLTQLLESFSKLNYDNSNFEIILVDDHSEDGTETEAIRMSSGFSNVKIISLDKNRFGKKAALTQGIDLAKGEVIATTDADCIVSHNWLQKISEGFHQETNMLIGAVALENKEGIFGKLQALEFTSVISTGLSLCALGKPTMCNGANLAFRKQIFKEVEGYSGNEQIASGDDEFLMRKIEAKYPKSIKVMGDCIVETKQQASLPEFTQQRLRWAGKWKANTSLFARSLAVFIFLVQILWLALIIWSGISQSSIVLSFLILKVFVDFIFLFIACRLLKVKFHSIAFIALQFLYPFYVLYIGTFSHERNHQWKGRKI